MGISNIEQGIMNLEVLKNTVDDDSVGAIPCGCPAKEYRTTEQGTRDEELSFK